MKNTDKLNYFLFICGLTGVVLDAHALSPQEIYRQAERQVFVLEVLNEQGAVFSYLTAVLLDPDTVATQCDSVQGAPSLRLRQGAEIYPAQLAQKDSARNLCLLHAPGAGESSVKLRDDVPQAGVQVYAVSNALGLGISIAEGVVSGVRALQGESFIQHTAAIAPGSEGGGLFDAEGKLVGLISYRQRDGQNVNFAFPAQWLKEIGQRAASADAAEAWRAKALALEREAKWDDLAAHATAWSKALADSAEAWLWLGSAHIHRQDWPAAELAYREALRYEPSATQAGVALARVLLAQNKAQPALEVAKSMLRYRAEDARIWLAIGAAERALGHTDEAKQAFAYSAQLEPWNSEAYTGLVSIANLRGDWPGALSAQRQVMQIDAENSFHWVDLARLYVLNARPERALASAEHAIALAPGSGDAWLFKGGALSGLKRHHEAIDAMQKAITLKPHRPEVAWGWLADIYYELHLFPQAIAAYREALKLTPDDDGLKGRYGLALKDGLQLAEALRLFEKLRDVHPEDPFAWRQIGYVHSYLGQAEAAIPAYEKSLSFDRKQAKVWSALMEAYHSAGRREDVKRAHQNLLGVNAAWAEQSYRKLILPYQVAQ
ncbi:MAG: tetratricopeptide repeat protein [Hydrogenophilales bacterium]|nr:tetratricopeptide repeat protein [Hydrogenophilales bacterium]